MLLDLSLKRQFVSRKKDLYGIFRNYGIRFFIGIFFFCAVFVFSDFSIAADTVGYINIQRIIQESTLGQKVAKKFYADFDKSRILVKQEIDKLEKLKQELQAKADKKNGEWRKKKIAEIQEAYDKYESMKAWVENSLVDKNSELIKKILKNANPFVEKVARSRGYAIILKEPNSIGFLDPRVDITDEVLKSMGTAEKAGEIKK